MTSEEMIKKYDLVKACEFKLEYKGKILLHGGLWDFPRVMKAILWTHGFMFTKKLFDNIDKKKPSVPPGGELDTIESLKNNKKDKPQTTRATRKKKKKR